MVQSSGQQMATRQVIYPSNKPIVRVSSAVYKPPNCFFSYYLYVLQLSSSTGAVLQLSRHYRVFSGFKEASECSLRINVSPRKGFWYGCNCWRICGTHFNQYHLAVGGSKINLQRINESLNAPLSLILTDVPLQRLLNVDFKNIHPPLLRHRIVKGRKSWGEM